MDDQTTSPPLDAPATFTNADRALLIAIAGKLNQQMPADLQDAPASSMLPTPPFTPPAFDPPGSAAVGAAPAFDFNTTGPISAAPTNPDLTVPANTAPAFDPPGNSPALAGLPQPAAPAVPRDTKIDFTAGHASDLAAVVALIREKFPHSLPDEIPSTVAL